MHENSTLAVPESTSGRKLPGLSASLSIPEYIAAVFFIYAGIAGWRFHLEPQQIGFSIALSALTFGTFLVLQRNRQRAAWLDAAANFFPALLLLVAYRETGLFLGPDTTHRLDEAFITWDRLLLHGAPVQAVLKAAAPWLQHYLELAYLLCYPLVPLGAMVVYWSTRKKVDVGKYAATDERAMNGFWSLVLLATLFSYAVYPFFPLTPPRVLFGDLPGPHVDPLLRRLNFWLLDHYGVQACLFPSGHVAAATAVAIAVRKYAPPLTAWFILAGASIAAATVYGRYHYFADALAGMLVGMAAAGFLKLLAPPQQPA